MRLLTLSYILLGCVFITGCKKSGSSSDNGGSPSSTYKLTIVSGNAQTDTVGNLLASDIFIKATNNGNPLNGYRIEYQGSGCNVDLISEAYTASDGTSEHSWQLASDIGPQTLKIRLFDSYNKLLDSVTATATAIAQKPGWHRCACQALSEYYYNFCTLKSGRVYAAIQGTLPRYSDDNGLSWHAMYSLGSDHKVVYILSTPTDELLAVAGNEGIYYSNDNGSTWTFKGKAPFATEDFISAIYTKSGKLFCGTGQGHLYLSTDKGASWKNVAAIVNNFQVYNIPVEASDGTLFILDQGGDVFKSTDNAQTWQQLSNYGVASGTVRQMYSLAVGNSGTLYSGQEANGTLGLYTSQDNGATFTLKAGTNNIIVQQPQESPGGKIYYLGVNSGLSTINSKNAPQVVYPYYSNGAAPFVYTVANNGNVIVETGGGPLFYYYAQ